VTHQRKYPSGMSWCWHFSVWKISVKEWNIFLFIIMCLPGWSSWRDHPPYSRGRGLVIHPLSHRHSLGSLPTCRGYWRWNSGWTLDTGRTHARILSIEVCHNS